ncbi:uncharacterized protein KGF55_002197 [Candida pseudojiufengensis]|uniref:uncharacterized protein n=1 Tax=Candida pseudojiufengensis TaxID=497109 RepID=UPI0022241404|nr:uncharacterized protein KGF55_002197 [Candida pseudojiufengensis]KAI5964255.1 hypothetical protein KGF55_002197 [Candida pseudojiufengensis]
MPVPIPHKYHDEINENGFTVIRNFLTPEEIDRYTKASEIIVDMARRGEIDSVRTTNKMFPPWPKNFSPDIWGVSGLLHPNLGEKSYEFHNLYGDEKMLNIVSDILQISKDEISMELLNMLINPLTDFELDWHRDTIKPEVTPEEEAEELLTYPFAGAQFNLSLTPDDCLIVIPKSHNRIRTEEERNKTIDSTRRKEFITNQIIVNLNPGDLVFYNNNILHRAKYNSKNKRLTLHGSYGNVKFGKSRAKGILQHGVADWLPDLKPQNENLNMMKSKLVDLAKEFEGVDVEFALDG